MREQKKEKGQRIREVKYVKGDIDKEKDEVIEELQ